MKESTLVPNVDINPQTQCNTYNDFFGDVGNIFPPAGPNQSTLDDNMMDDLLRRLQSLGAYSKNIDDIKFGNDYNEYIDDWKVWIDYNVKNWKDLEKSMFFKYIDIFNDIKRGKEMKENISVLKKIDLFLIEEIESSVYSEILKLLNLCTSEFNILRKSAMQYSEFNIIGAFKRDTETIIQGLNNPKSPFWTKGSKASVFFTGILDLEPEIDKITYVNLLKIIINFKTRLGNIIDLLNNIDKSLSGNLKKAMAKDFAIWKRAVGDKSGQFWSKRTDISFGWTNTLDYINKKEKTIA